MDETEQAVRALIKQAANVSDGPLARDLAAAANDAANAYVQLEYMHMQRAERAKTEVK